MKKLLFLLIASAVLFFSATDVSAQRIAECDSCGYCNGRPVPENWVDCAQCLYPTQYALNSNPTANETLKINEDKTADNYNKPPTPASGKYYTQIGCLGTDIASFTDANAGGGVLNFLLNNLIFPAVGVLAFGVIIYGAFLLVTAQGDRFKIEQGKRMITSAIVGLIFTFGVVLIVNIIGSDILRIPGFSRADQVTISARASATTEPDGKVYPIMEFYLNGKLLKTYTTKDNGSYYAVLPKDTPLTADIRVRFSNDWCPGCSGGINGSTGDRNIFIDKWQIGENTCKAFTYYHENGGTTSTHGSTVGMFYKGYITCNAY